MTITDEIDGVISYSLPDTLVGLKVTYTNGTVAYNGFALESGDHVDYLTRFLVPAYHRPCLTKGMLIVGSTEIVRAAVVPF